MSEQAQGTTLKSADQPMVRVISTLLVIGVALSAAVLAAGLALLAVSGQTGYHDVLTPELLVARQGTVAFPRTIGGVLQGVLDLKPFAVIELGALLLIATPVLRVAVSVVLFSAERDRVYVAITLVVLFLLLVSVFWVG